MSENMKVYESARTVPPEALKPIQAGRLKGMSDINPMWRIKKLTELFGMCGVGWKTVITDKRLERGSEDQIVCFVDIELYVKVDGQWSEAIPGMGGSSFIAKETSRMYTSDECFKMAYTDAISVACKSLGFAADVYFEKDRTKYSDQEDTTNQQPQKPSQPRTDRQAPPSNEDLAAIEQASEERFPRSASGSSSGGGMKRVLDLRTSLNMDWKSLNELASNVLGREVKYPLKNNVNGEEEWKKIEDALLMAKAS